jgi:hypothetical protein
MFSVPSEFWVTLVTTLVNNTADWLLVVVVQSSRNDDAG